MLKSESVNVKNPNIWVGVLVYCIAYWIFNVNGLLIDNDTIEYIGFAKKYECFTIPKSPYYQPGTGLFIWVIKKLLNINYIFAFRVLNFISGLFLVVALIKILPPKEDHRFLSISMSLSPVVLYLSSLLYADIVFLAVAFWGLVFLVKHTETDKIHGLIVSGILFGISIFIKYNGIAITVSGCLFLALIYFKKDKGSIKKILAKIIILSLPSILYVIFWKIYNGKLGLVEFTNYMHKVDFECIMFYLKLNTLSLYRLVIDRLTLGLTSFVSHYYLWFAILLSIFGFRKKLLNMFKINNMQFYNKQVLLLLIVAIVYAVAVTTMHSLNCYSEPEVRLYSITFIGGLIILVMILMRITDKLINKYFKIMILISALLYQTFILVRILAETSDARVSLNNSKYSKIIGKLKVHLKGENLKGYATPLFNRHWFALGGDYSALAIFHGQRHFHLGQLYEYNDSQYKEMVRLTVSDLKSNYYLVVECSEDFILRNESFLKKTTPVFKEDNIYVFRGSDQ